MTAARSGRRRDHRRARMTAWISTTGGSRSSSRGPGAVNGLVLLVFPGVVGWVRVRQGRPATRRRGRLLRLVGVRDLVLGIGAITTLKEHTMDAEWVGMGAVADAVDGVVSLVTPGLARRRAVRVARRRRRRGGRSARVAPARRRARAARRQKSIPESSGIQSRARLTAVAPTVAVEHALSVRRARGAARSCARSSTES